MRGLVQFQQTGLPFLPFKSTLFFQLSFVVFEKKLILSKVVRILVSSNASNLKCNLDTGVTALKACLEMQIRKVFQARVVVRQKIMFSQRCFFFLITWLRTAIWMLTRIFFLKYSFISCLSCASRAKSLIQTTGFGIHRGQLTSIPTKTTVITSMKTSNTLNSGWTCTLKSDDYLQKFNRKYKTCRWLLVASFRLARSASV